MQQAQVISFHYVLTNKTGDEIDSSRNSEPMMFLTGSGQIIPGLEKVLVLMQKGDKKKISVAAAEAYGEVDAELIFDVPRSQFPADDEVQVGMRFQTSQEHSPIFTVTAVSDTNVKVDGNHPLAGQDLVFDVEIIEYRAATAEEIAHGHAHGAGGHHHH